MGMPRHAGRVACTAGIVTFLLVMPLAGVDTGESGGLVWHTGRAGAVAAGIAALVFVGRMLGGHVFSATRAVFKMDPRLRGDDVLVSGPRIILKSVILTPGRGTGQASAGTNFQRLKPWLPVAVLLAALLFPMMPFASRYALDIALSILTYMMLAWGLNVTVGYAGLLDLGYAGFYAIGAYGYALLARHFGLGFWSSLPLAGMLAAAAAVVVGGIALRLRGDYFAMVTLGFGEIVRLAIINGSGLTGGPQGIGDIPRPTLFGLSFDRSPPAGQASFSDFFHIGYDPIQRVQFLYIVILALASLILWALARIRTLPLGRAWEAFRENEIAATALGLDRRWLTLAAYAISAAIAGMAGAFFAARQGFISPESFTFTESATLLAIVILGGSGHPLGIAAAAAFVVGMPELFRGFDRYRMIAFGLGMVLIMIWRPSGMTAKRKPTALMHPGEADAP